jgi:hypothetical protein
MIQRFHRPVATWLSTNHPVLWVVRADVAILVAVLLALLGVPIVWTGGTMTDALLQMVGEGGDRIPRYRVESILDNLQITLQLLTGGLGAAAALLWFGTVYRSAYKAVSPAMRIYPRIIDLFIPLALIAFITATAIVTLDMVMARGSEGSSYETESDPKWILAKYLFAFEPALVLAMIFALLLRWSVAASLTLTVVATAIVGGTLWLAVVTIDYLPRPLSNEIVVISTVVIAGLVCLFAPFWIARSPRNTRVRRVLVALSIPMAMLAVGGLEVCFMIGFNTLARDEYVQRVGSHPILRDFGPQIFFITHCVLALFFMQLIYVRWARLILRPQ